MVLAWTALLAGPSFAQGGSLFDERERAALGHELRAALLADPEPVWQAFNPPAPSPYQDDIDRDLVQLSAAAGELFDPAATEIGSPEAEKVLALFVRPSCAGCERARADLAALAERLDLRVTVFDLDQDAALAERIGVDMAPSYVLPRMIVRGDVPAAVIEKYLTR
ncbi:glutaredoxin family protein [Thalassobius aquimarinus]|uniref:Glutaredoxin family protein n=1 Tax=Thalassovita aquimarina TaxID=2785917 RepID=A0ABS5HSW3_9RHOB|nr:glutaredoxin family protein [Thalassovita aquimarina]